MVSIIHKIFNMNILLTRTIMVVFTLPYLYTITMYKPIVGYHLKESDSSQGFFFPS